MNLNILYYLSVIILVTCNIIFLKYNQFNNKYISTLIMFSIIIFLFGNYNFLTSINDEKYIYVKPNYKPIVISWDNQLSQKII
jgi:hypothetical protein